MAFENKTSGAIVKATGLKVDEAYEGYVLKLVKSQKYDQTNLVMKNAVTGKIETFLTAGNLKYVIADGGIELGQLTRITRLEDRKVKGKVATTFRVEQDPDKILSGSAIEEAAAQDAEEATGPSAASMKNEEVKRRAAMLKAGIEKQN